MKPKQIPIQREIDVLVAARIARELTLQLGGNEVDAASVETVVTELARNALIHAGGGQALLSSPSINGHTAIRIQITDHGPGIPNLIQALNDGFSTSGTLGVGLGAAQRLMHEFELHTTPGQGTTVIVTRWLNTEGGT